MTPTSVPAPDPTTTTGTPASTTTSSSATTTTTAAAAARAPVLRIASYQPGAPTPIAPARARTSEVGNLVKGFEAQGFGPTGATSFSILLGFVDFRDRRIQSLLQLDDAFVDKRLAIDGILPDILAYDIPNNDPLHRALPIAAQTTISATNVEYARGREMLDVEFALVGNDSLARLWVDGLFAQGRQQQLLRQFTLGPGYVAGPSGVVDAGSTLVRPTWSDGQPWDTGGTQSSANGRMAVHVEAVTTIIEQLHASA